MSESDISDFFKKGFLECAFKENKNLSLLNQNLTCIYENKIKNNFFLKEKYKNTKDLRPTAFDYDKSFLDIIFDNNIHEQLDHITQKNMLLAHVQVRASKAGNSYMPWHRDVYSTNLKNVGMMPPAIKLIYYLPSENHENKLELLQGSHRIAVNNLSEKTDFILPGFSKFDNQLFAICHKYFLKNNKFNYLLFDTSCAHSVCETKHDSIRIIYTFSTEYQIRKTFSGGRHIELMEKYRCLKIKK
jgi:hypothetical protein